MATLGEEIQRVNLELRHIAFGDEDVRLLMTITEVGCYITLIVKAGVGDINRFHSGDHLARYAGIVPSTYSSVKVTHHGRITRERSAWLRWAMVETPLVRALRGEELRPLGWP
jgi:transposase